VSKEEENDKAVKKLIEMIGPRQIIESLMRDRLFVKKNLAISIALEQTPVLMVHIYKNVTPDEANVEMLRRAIHKHIRTRAIITKRDWEEIFDKIAPKDPIAMAVILACIRGCDNFEDMVALNQDFLWQACDAEVVGAIKKKCHELFNCDVPMAAIINNCGKESPLALALSGA
jgi:hypothetical protein